MENEWAVLLEIVGILAKVMKTIDKKLIASKDNKTLETLRDVLKELATALDVEEIFQGSEAKKIPLKEIAAPSANTTNLQGPEKAEVLVEQAQPRLSTAQATAPDSPDTWQQKVEAATFRSNTDKIVLNKALSDLASNDPAERIFAAQTLAAVHHDLAVKVLTEQLKNEQSAQVRRQCVKSLASLEMEEAHDAIEYALNDEQAAVRLAALWGLYRLGKAENIPSMIRMLSDKDGEIRRRAVTCIGWSAPKMNGAIAAGILNDQKEISALIRCLNDPSKSVRTAVFSALQEVTGKNITADLPQDKLTEQDIIKAWKNWWKQKLL